MKTLEITRRWYNNDTLLYSICWDTYLPALDICCDTRHRIKQDNIRSDIIFECHMGWLWLVGSLKLQVSFAKEPYQRDDILQKRIFFIYLVTLDIGSNETTYGVTWHMNVISAPVLHIFGTHMLLNSICCDIYLTAQQRRPAAALNMRPWHTSMIRCNTLQHTATTHIK